jgi:hypothetical protein
MSVCPESDLASVKAKIISFGVGSDRKQVSSNSITLAYTNPKFVEKGKEEAVTPPDDHEDHRRMSPRRYLDL